jgi:hypothetical protein
VQRDVKLQEDKNTALLEATLNKESKPFVKGDYFVFEPGYTFLTIKLKTKKGKRPILVFTHFGF